MALHTDTAIYRDAYGLLRVCAQPLVNMPRNARAVFGVCLRDRLLENLELIHGVNVARGTDKVAPLNALLQSVRDTDVLLRLCHDKRYIADGAYADAIQLSTSVGKQAHGLRKTYATAPAT